MIRRARAEDVDATARIYEALMDREEAGQGATNWKRGVYPTRETARRADVLHEGVIPETLVLFEKEV